MRRLLTGLIRARFAGHAFHCDRRPGQESIEAIALNRFYNIPME